MRAPRKLFIIGLITLFIPAAQYAHFDFFSEKNNTINSDTLVNEIQVKNSDDEVLFKIIDEGDGVSLFLPPLSMISNPDNKLYNLNNSLHWNNITIGNNQADSWIQNGNNIYLSENIENIGFGTLNPEYKLHIKEGRIFIQGSTNWFPGLTINNPIGRSVLNIQGTTNSENFRSAEIVLGDLTNSSNWSILNTVENRLIFVSHLIGSEYRTPFQIDFSAPSNSLTINSSGNIGIGAWSDEHKLAVAGSIISEEVVVKLQSDWPDYVFSNEYVLLNLSQLEKYIDEHRHLPGIPSSVEIGRDGINISEIQIKLLEKIEELTLYVIDQNKKIEDLLLEIENLKTDFE